MLSFRFQPGLGAPWWQWTCCPRRKEHTLVTTAPSFLKMDTLTPQPSAPVKLITILRVRDGEKERFLEWNGRMGVALMTGEGFASREIIPPQGADFPEWVIVNRFDCVERLRAWRGNPARAELLSEAKAFLETDPVELAGDAAAQIRVENSVTEVILDHVAPGREEAYREWSGRIQQAQALFSGYQGGYSQPPKLTGTGWMTLMRFASPGDLERWMSSPERQRLLEEAKDLVTASHQHRVDTSFPGWVPTDAAGNAPPNWKTTMLVLLGLYPIVCLEILFLMKLLGDLGLASALAGFVGNAISVALTGYVTMPWLCRWFDWWLMPGKNAAAAVHWKGTLIIAACYALSIAVFWKWM